MYVVLIDLFLVGFTFCTATTTPHSTIGKESFRPLVSLAPPRRILLLLLLLRLLLLLLWLVLNIRTCLLVIHWVLAAHIADECGVEPPSPFVVSGGASLLRFWQINE